MADASLDAKTWDGTRVGVVIGCGMGGAATWEEQHRRMLEHGPDRVSAMLIPMLVPNMVAGQLAMEFGAKGPNLVTATACASGATAIGVARDLLRGGACDIVLTGGTEAGLTPLSIAGFAQMGALSHRVDDPGSASRPFDSGRDGFVAAEAAILAALVDADVAPSDVTHVNAHGTSTPLNDVSEARTIKRVLGDQAVVTSTKGVTGHSLGAAGAIEAAFSVLTVEQGLIPPTANLESQDPEIEIDVVAKAPREAKIEVAISNSFGFGGQNAVLVVTPA